LLVMEHISQEMNRLLVIVSEQIAASMVLFFRSGAWCLGAIGWMFLVPEQRNLDSVFICWFIGNLCAISIGFWCCARLNARGWNQKVDWFWIRKGLKVAIPLLIGSLALRGIYTIDRYWFGSLVSLEILGAYVVFTGMCNALMSFLDAGVFMYAYPELIRKFNASNLEGFKLEIRKLWLQTLGLSLVFVVISAICLPLVLAWLDRSIYRENMQLFWLLLVAMFFYAISMVPHYGLYARGKDKEIIFSHIIALIVFFPSVWFISLASSYLAVPLGLILTFVVLFLLKKLLYLRSIKE